MDGTHASDPVYVLHLIFCSHDHVINTSTLMIILSTVMIMWYTKVMVCSTTCLPLYPALPTPGPLLGA